MRASDQPIAATSDPMVLLAPEDADTAFVAGVQFARALAGAEPAVFMMALGEQQALIQCAVREAGYPDPKARAAGKAFEAGAKLEWRRIGELAPDIAWGTA